MTNLSHTSERNEPRGQPKSAVNQWLRAFATNEGSLVIGLLLLVVVLNAPYFQIPLFWDGLTFVAGANYIFEHGFTPSLPKAWDTIGHPLLFHEILALAWLWLGRALWVSHLVIFGFAWIAVYYTYRLGQFLYGRRVGIIGALLLLFYPLFRAQSTVVTLDLPAAGLAVMTLYFLIKRRTLLYVLSASALLLTKETGILLIPVGWLYLIATNYRQKSWRAMLPLLMVYSLPVFFLAGWFWYHQQTAGWLAASDKITTTRLLSPYLPPMLFTRQGALYISLQLAWRFFGKSSWIGFLTLLVFVYSFSLRPFLALFRGQFSWPDAMRAVRAQPIWRVWGPAENLIIVGLPILLYLAFMAWYLHMHRYMLPAYPLFFILCAKAIAGLFRHPGFVALATAVSLAIFTFGWTQTRLGDELYSPSNMRYADFVETHQVAAAFIESRYPDAIVLSGWPEYIELTMPVQGYVKRPFKVIAYADGARYEERLIMLGGRYFTDPQAVTLADFSLLYYSEHSVYADMLREIVARYQLPMIAEFQKNAEYVAIYANPGTIDLVADQAQ